MLLIGGGLGNAVLFSIGQALRRNGSRVIYFAGYKRAIDRYKVEEIERAADVIVWCCDEAPGFRAERAQDKAFVGNIVAALDAYGSEALGPAPIPLGEVDRVIAIGSDGMMAAVGRARQGILAQHFKPGHKAIASINSPMQCMMKEICAQCLQVHRDPASGVESVVFSCFNQDQDLDRVDFDNLRARLGQNGVQENSRGCGSTARCGSSDCGKRQRSSCGSRRSAICCASGYGGSFALKCKLERDDAGNDEGGAEPAPEAARVAEEPHADDERSGGPDAGPDRIGRSERNLLLRQI